MVKFVDVPDDEAKKTFAYTNEEGGTVYTFECPWDNVEAYSLALQQELQQSKQWIRNKSAMPGRRDMTKLGLLPGDGVMRVHSVFFPDGRIWDSSLRDFDPRFKWNPEKCKIEGRDE